MRGLEAAWQLRRQNSVKQKKGDPPVCYETRLNSEREVRRCPCESEGIFLWGTCKDQAESDTFLCPAGQTLARKQLSRKDRVVIYAGQPDVCGSCALKSQCTTRSRRLVTQHLHEEALQRMQQRATPEAMRLRRSTVEHPFANLKYRIFGHPRFLLRGLRGAQTEISLAVAAYNLKRMRNILGGHRLASALQTV
jgi:Transposase DDE domain